MTKQYNSFSAFYPFYKTEHAKTGTRILHFVGTSLFIVMLVLFFIYFDYRLILMGILFAYGFAWISHFFIEKNKPATFQYPLYSLASDFKLYFEIVIGKEWLVKPKG